MNGRIVGEVQNDGDERPKVDTVDWIGDAYPVNADPERDTWNGKSISRDPRV